MLLFFLSFVGYSRYMGHGPFRRDGFPGGGGRERFEDEDQAYAEEVAETYMRLLEPVVFD